VGLDLDAASELMTEWIPSWMTPDQITQRIGRVGRRAGKEYAFARIYVPGADNFIKGNLSEHHGQSMSKDRLHELLIHMSEKSPFRRESYVSYYYPEENMVKLYDKGLLEPYEKLRYCFRPPGSQALFLDCTESEPHLFIYEKVPILNRYDCTPPTNDDILLLDDGWRNVCTTLGLDIEQDMYVIRGERNKRGWLPIVTGHLDDLRKNTLRRFYLERSNPIKHRSLFT